MLVPLKVLVVKAVLLLMMGPLAISGALLGWLFGRTIWNGRSTRKEAQLRRAFAEIVTIAEPPKARPPARDEG